MCFFIVLFLRLVERKCGNSSKIYHLLTANFAFIVRDLLIVKYLDNCVNCYAGWTKMRDREKLC